MSQLEERRGTNNFETAIVVHFGRQTMTTKSKSEIALNKVFVLHQVNSQERLASD